MKIDNLAAGQVAELVAQVKAQQTASPLGASQISRGQLIITTTEAEGPGFEVSGFAEVSGTLSVTGLEVVDGELQVTGDFVLSGPATISGNTSVTGTLTITGTTTLGGNTLISGNTKITGTLEVDGASTLENSLTMGAAGSIIAGALTISQGGGAGGSIVSSGTLNIGGNYIAIAGGTTLSLAATSVQFFSAPTTTNAANTYLNPSTGQIFRVSSARRFKTSIRRAKFPDALLDVPVKQWIDKGARKRGEPDAFIPGVIAEEVAEAGGDLFVTHGPDGEVEGVAYDRLALARTQLLADRLDAALKRISELEAAIARKPAAPRPRAART